MAGMREKPIYDSSLFWVGFGAAVAVIGGIFSAIGVADAGSNAGARIWSDSWFRVGIGLVVLATLMLWWALTLYVAHRHADRHPVAAEKVPAERRDRESIIPKSGQRTAQSPGPAQLRADLAADLEAVKEFYAELEKIVGPRPSGGAATQGDEKAEIGANLLRYFQDQPITPNEFMP